VKLELSAFAVPLVGIGAFVHLASRGRRAALGDALSGFGLFFVGIGVLGQTFASLGDSVDLAGLARPGLLGVLLFVVIGFGLTALVQSSSAALTLVLSAAAGGVVPFDAAAATVIGTNLGTTSTALLAVVGATPNARRVAAAHVVFNLIAALAALVLLPVLLFLVDRMVGLLALEATPVSALALFHTSFNLLGVAIVWPLRRRLVRTLAARFRSREEDESTPRFLDQTVVGTPVLALAALARELRHTNDLACRMARSALTRGPAAEPEIALQRIALDGLHTAVSHFAAQIGRGELPEDLLAATTLALRAASDQAELAERAVEFVALRGPSLPAGAAREAIEHLEQDVLLRVQHAAPVVRSDAEERAEGGSGRSPEEPGVAGDALAVAYDAAKGALLRAVTLAELPAERWSVQLDRLRLARGIAEYAVKASRRLAELDSALDLPRAESPSAELPEDGLPDPTRSEAYADP
jgi:phosphate:Na+ symporter